MSSINMLSILDLCILAGFSKSKSEAKNIIKHGGIYLNNIKITDINYEPCTDDLLYDKYFVLRRGKKTFKVIKMQYVCEVNDILNNI